MVVFIAGGISGVADYKERFGAAVERLRGEGHIALSPAVLPVGLPYADYFKITYAMIEVSEAIYMLKDSNKSIGAMLEYRHAQQHGIEVIDETLGEHLQD